jgi:hypothetical protein
LIAGLELRESGGGTRLRLRVTPGARADAVTGVHAGALKVSVTAVPDRGRANDAVVRLLAEVLDLAPSAVTITAGHGSRNKTAAVALTAADVQARLAERLP